MSGYRLLLCCVLLSGCNDLTTAPTVILPTDPATCCKLPQPQPEPAQDVPEAPTTPAIRIPHGAGETAAYGLCKDIQQGVSCLVTLFTDSHVAVNITNQSPTAQLIAMESFSRWGEEFSEQRVFETHEMVLPAGESVDWIVGLPSCGWQVDVHLGPKVNHPPHVLHSLLGFEKSPGTLCPPPVVPPETPDPPPFPVPPVPPLTGCNAGVVDRSFVQGQTAATATFRVLPGYAVTLWAAGYQRMGGWDQQRYLGGTLPTVYREGTHTVQVPAASPGFQGDIWCGADFTNADVTPANIDWFNAMHDAFSFFVVER